MLLVWILDVKWRFTLVICRRYSLPTWADFEMGRATVFWETNNGQKPTSVSNCGVSWLPWLQRFRSSCEDLVQRLGKYWLRMSHDYFWRSPFWQGQLLTIYFNSSASSLTPNSEYGIGFNGILRSLHSSFGSTPFLWHSDPQWHSDAVEMLIKLDVGAGGFNQPIMCGGEPRIMAKKERGSLCTPIYSIKINVPLHGKPWEVWFLTLIRNWMCFLNLFWILIFWGVPRLLRIAYSCISATSTFPGPDWHCTFNRLSALTLEFSFTDGKDWDGPYKLVMDVPQKLKGLPQSYFDEVIA